MGNRTVHTENGTTTNQRYNQKNQLQTIGRGEGEDEQSASFTYNANGHTHSKTQNGIVTRYEYNHEERLIAVKRDGLTLGSYAYNPNGQRIKKTVNGNTTWYLYNENGLAAEYTSTGQLIKEYHFHPQKTWMTDPLFQRTAGGDVYYYHNDHLGTPQQLVDASGNVVWEAQYSAFGKAYITVSAVENNLRFPGQYYDHETGLHQNYFRDYDAELGRYIQSDPIGLRGGVNYYSYVAANPVVDYDSLGLSQMNRSPYAPGGAKAGGPRTISGFGWQIGTTTKGPGGWGQSGSVGVAGYMEICEKQKKCSADTNTPFASPPDSYSGTWYLMGTTIKVDGSICFMFGLILTWPPISPNWNIPEKYE